MRLRGGLAAILVVGIGLAAGVAVAAGASPLGLWKGQDGNTYRFVPLAHGGYAEIAVTRHRSSTGRCVVRAGTTIYRYHPLGRGIYSVDGFLWRKDCTTHWVRADERLRLRATAARMTLSCDRKYAKVCFTYRRLDSRPPVARALPSTGTAGGTTVLRYQASDNSGRTWEELTIYKDNAAIRHYRTKLGPAVRGRTYGYKLRATPASMRGRFPFCVVSHDAAGNRSTESCAEVTIR